MANELNVFVISLKDSQERRKHIRKHLDSLGIKFEWFDAVYGKALSEEELNKYCDREAMANAPHWLTTSAIGCALSHYGVYKEILNRNLPYALVLEDDVILEKNFLQCFSQLTSQLRKNEISLLYYQSWDTMKLVSGSKKTLCKGYDSYEPGDIFQPLTAAAYVITNDACRTMTEAIIPIRLCADTWGEYSKIKGFENFTCIYPRAADVMDAKSTIEYIGNAGIAKVMRFIDKYKIFPAYQLLKMKRKSGRQKMMKIQFVP